ncbi:MAG: hypothetical protein ABIG93_05210 [archaeon]|nr:hypothetical protein [Nanoarchaeota archaeon]
MRSDPRVAQIVSDSGAYSDKEPLLLASGKIGIYYSNTELTLRDGNAYKKHENDSLAMLNYALEREFAEPTFAEIIDALTERVKPLLSDRYEEVAIAGGQTRDWLFSGPVAARLAIPHISLYKDGKIELIYGPGEAELEPRLRKSYAVHIGDLITSGSSTYSPLENPSTGWVPMLRAAGVTVDNSFTVVSRLQGGEENLAQGNVQSNSLVFIDEDFLRKHSKNPERAVAYKKDPDAWSEQYLRENGALAFIANFDPNGKNLVRARRFLEHHSHILKDAGRMKGLEAAVLEQFGKPLDEIVVVGGK